MKKVFLFPLLAFLITQGMTAQVKLGDNPQNIDPASLFELESSDQVLVITRVSTAELQAITPSMGALAYNTDEKCLFYHTGDIWVNLCEALGRAFTTDAIQNEFPTIVITPLEESVNFEVGEIRSENILDFSIGSQDIQNNSINSEKLADASVGAAELQDNAVTGRNLDFVDITLSDFVNDVPFLVQGNLVAAAIFYDNTASGLGPSDIQAAIDALSSGLNDVDLRAVGDGTYVFTDSDGATTTFDLNASALRFDNTSNGFTATDVQGAIEEIQGSSSDDQNLTLNSPLLEIEDGNSVDLSEFFDNTDQQGLTLNGSILAIENGNTVDLSGLTSGVNTDEQQITQFNFEPTTNILTLEIENATTESVDLSTLDQPAPDGSETRIENSPTVTVTGSGTTADPYQLASAGGADGSETIIENTATVTVAGSGTAADPYLLTSAGGADGSETIIDNSSTVTVAGTGTTADPYILTSTGGTGGADGSETILNSTATVLVSGTGTAADPYLLESTGGADGSETVIDNSATVTVSGIGTAADPYVLTSTGGTGGGDGSETIIETSPTVIVSGTGTTVDPYILESTGGADGSETVIETSPTVIVNGTGTTLDPYVLESTGGADGSETVIEDSGTVTVTGTGTTADPYVLESTGGADGSETVIEDSATVTVSGSGTTADPYTLESAGGAEDQIASEVPFSPIGTTESDNVQAAIEELQTDIDGLAGNTPNPNDELIETFELNGTSLEITEAGVLLPAVDLDPVFATDADLLTAIAVSDAADGDIDPANEIQVITSTDGSIAITQTGDDYDLTVIGSSDDQNILGSSFDISSETLTIGIEGGTSEDVSLASFALDTDLATAITDSETADGDRDNTNEIQIITSTDGSVGVNQTGNDYDLSVPISSDDQNIQGSSFDIASETITIGIEGGTSENVSLADFALDSDLATAITASETADGDRDDTNEIQTITSTDGSVGITQTGDDYNLTVPGSSDDQNIQGSSFDLTSETLTIGIEGGASEIVNLSSFALDTDLATAITASEAADGDKNDTNEIELPAGGNTGDILSTNGAGVYTWINNSVTVSTDGATILGNGSGAPLTVGEISGGPAGNIATNSITQGDIDTDAVGNGELRDNSVGESELQDEAVTPSKIEPGVADGQVLTTSGGAVVWGAPANSRVSTWGKISNGSLTKGSGITSITGTAGQYTVNFDTPFPDDDYTVQLSVFGNNSIYVTTQTNATLSVEIRSRVPGSTDGNLVAADFYITIID